MHKAPDDIIRIYQADGLWRADMSETREASVLEDLFGTAIQPTAFRDTVPAERVVAQLELLNPDCIVVVRTNT